MRLRRLLFAALCLGVVLTPTRAQNSYDPEGGEGGFGQPKAPGSEARKAYEDIDVFRLLLNRALSRHYGFHGMPHFVKDAHHNLSQAEGVYLKGHGVVFTFTAPMPPHENPVAAPDRAPAKEETAWERARRELRGEKADDKEQKGGGRKETLSEVVLKLLAENGRHFSQLAPDEKVTVAVTFRGASTCINCHMNPWDVKTDTMGFDPSDTGKLPGTGGSSLPLDRASGGDGSLPPSGGFPPGGTSPPSSRYPPGGTSPPDSGFPPGGGNQPPGPISSGWPAPALLGDLHMRQGKHKEAAEEYRKALDRIQHPALNADVKSLIRGGEIASKLAQAHLASGNASAAQDAMRQARDFTSQALQAAQLKALTSAGQKKPAVPVPPRLIVSAPKRLLDQVGAGKMTFEEFRKSASVEYLDFAAKDDRGGK